LPFEISAKSNGSHLGSKLISNTTHNKILNDLLLGNKVREYLWGNEKWRIQRNWQHRVHKAKKNKTKTQHNMAIDIP
jgi:hypothetical protein